MKKILLIIVTTIFYFNLFSQGEWELKKEKDDIKIYTRAVNGSNIKEYKAEAIMKGKLSNFVAVFKDVDGYLDFYKHAKEVELIEMNDTFMVYYMVTNAPWPVTDRDGVYSSTFRQYYNTKLIRIDIKLETGYRDENDDYVRMMEANGFWLFYPLDYNKVEVTYQMHAEPGGSIPNWVINMFIIDTPLDDMEALRERVLWDKYANQKFEFLVE